MLTKQELLDKVWPDTFVEESNLAYDVFALRKALGDPADGQSPTVARTADWQRVTFVSNRSGDLEI